MDEDSSSSFSNQDLEVARVLASSLSLSSSHDKSESKSLPSFTNPRSHSSGSMVKQSPFRPATVLTNLTRGNTATVTPISQQQLTVHQLAGKGEIDLIKHTFVNFNEEDASGFTPIMWACAYNQLATATFLFDQGADASHVANQGECALILACSKGHDAVASYLINDCHCKIDVIDQIGNTALIHAVNGNHIKCVRLLLMKGADLTHRNMNELSAFDVAVNLKHFEIQKELEHYLLSFLDYNV